MRPMGFGEQKDNEKLKPLLVLCMHKTDLKRLSKDAAGADAVLVDSADIKKEELKALVGSSGGAVWGGGLKETGSGEVEKLKEAGFDFIAFNESNASGGVLENSNLGRILKLDVSLDESLLRTIGGLPVDSVLLGGDYLSQGHLKWQHLMLIKRFAGMLPQPIMVTIPNGLSDSELKALWDMGIDGFTLEIEKGGSLESLSCIRKKIDAIKWPQRHDKSKKGALLPGVGFGEETDE